MDKTGLGRNKLAQQTYYENQYNQLNDSPERLNLSIENNET